MYYKVVRYDLRSIKISQNTATVRYKIGEFVGPQIKGSPLLVFDALDKAQNFAYDNSGHVYSCEVKKPRKPIQIAIHYCDDIWSYWQNLFNNRKSKKKMRRGLKFPEGTVFCNEVKLLEKII